LQTGPSRFHTSQACALGKILLNLPEVVREVMGDVFPQDEIQREENLQKRDLGA
jgi:hypothetical protein